MPRIFLTHTPEALRNYYGDRAIAGLSCHGDIIFNDHDTPLSSTELAKAAAGCEIIVSDRRTPGDAQLFEQAKDLVAFVRCAVDIRTVDVASASRHGILVTNASPGFVDAVVELIIGFMVDLARNVGFYVRSYREGEVPHARMGRQLAVRPLASSATVRSEPEWPSWARCSV